MIERNGVYFTRHLSSNPSHEFMRLFIPSFRIALFALVLFSLSFSCAANAHAETSFYLTFERSFSPHEPVQLRMDYRNKTAPFHLRVLRPKDISAFLDGQINISRSYEEPRAAINPGHYVAAGMNKLPSPLRSLQAFLNPAFRNSFEGELSPPLKSAPASSVVAVPKRIVHEPPRGFEVIRELYLDLQRGGKDANDAWWWFFDEAADNSTFAVKTVAIGEIPSGLYLVQVVQGDEEAQALLQVSELSVQVKQSSSQLTVHCIDRSGRPIAGVTLSVRNSNGVWSDLQGSTDSSGLFTYKQDGELDGRLIIKAKGPDGTTAFADTDFLSVRPAAASMLIMTDRPIFRPGDEVNFKAFRRDSDNGALVTKPIAVKAVNLLRQDGSVATSVTQTEGSRFGTVSGTFAVGVNDSPGLYTVVLQDASQDTSAPYAGELRVRDYVKPTFYVELVSHEGQLRAGSTFKYRIRARRYAGGAAEGARFEVYVYRKKFDVPQFIEDAGGGLATGSDYLGQVTSTKATSQPQRIFSTVEAREKQEEDSPNAPQVVPAFDALGEATGEVVLPPIPQEPNDEWTYTIVFRAIDRTGSEAALSQNYYQTVARGIVAGKFSKTITKPGTTDTRYNVRVTTPDGEPLEGVKGAVSFVFKTSSNTNSTTELSFVTGSSGYATIDLPRYTDAGVLLATAIARGDATGSWPSESRSEESELLIINGAGDAVKQVDDVVLYTDATVLSPGEETSLYVLLPDTWGVENKGMLWRTIASDRILASESIPAHGRSHIYKVTAKEEYGTGFFETVTVPIADGKFREASVGFRIVPWKKRLKINVSPERPIGEPMKPFKLTATVLDHKDAPVARAEVSLAVVDRAVFAIQPEFRPKLLDFFFPMPRLNVMSFYSDDLQGYGYADTIRKPNFSLTAIKSQVKLSKRSVRDTAGWFPHLITNDRGEVSVDVHMPANLTEWTVSATAVDNSGRMGEGEGSFRTAVDVDVDVRAPQFMRAGDSLQAPVTVHNQLDRAVSVSFGGSAAQGSLQTGTLATEVENIPAKGSFTRSVPLQSENLPETTILSVLGTTKDDVRLWGTREYEINSLPSAEPRVLTSLSDDGKSLAFDIPPSSQSSSLSLVVTKGLEGVVFERLKELLSYPYGCGEQLVHSIFPNVVLLELAKDAPDALQGIDGVPDLLRKARANIVTGIGKLALNKKGNGYALWPSDPGPSKTVTLMVFDLFRRVADLEIEAASALNEKTQTQLNEWKDGTWSPYELALLGDGASDSRIVSLQSDFVRGVLLNKDASLGEMVYALKLLTAYRSASWHRFNRNLEDLNAEPQIRDKLLARLDRGQFSQDAGTYPDGLFSGELLGFSPSGGTMLSEVYGVLVRSNDAAGEKTSKIISKLKARILVELRNGDYWSPLDFATLIDNVLPSIKKELQNKSSGTNDAMISVKSKDGTLLGELKQGSGIYLATLPIPSGKQLDLTSISLTNVPGDTAVIGRLSVLVPFASATATSQGISVERTLLKIGAHGAEPLKSDAKLKVGDVVVSKVEVSRSEPTGHRRSFSEWFIVRDSVPALGQLIDEDKTYLADAGIQPADDTYWASVKETLRYPDRIERVIRLAPHGNFISYAVWRIGYAGDTWIGPARAFNMYAKGVEGATSSGRISALE